MSISLKKPTSIAAFVISPIIITSLGSALSSLTRVYVSSGIFVLSIFLGALVTSIYYSQGISNKVIMRGFVIVFGIIVAILYINAAHEVFGSGIKVYSDNWSPIYLATSLIGLIEIILYVWIITYSLYLFVGRLIKKVIQLTSVFIKKTFSLLSPPKDNSTGRL